MRGEPCLCGDPECRRCFPVSYSEGDVDAQYERCRQREVDESAEEFSTF